MANITFKRTRADWLAAMRKQQRPPTSNHYTSGGIDPPYQRPIPVKPNFAIKNLGFPPEVIEAIIRLAEWNITAATRTPGSHIRVPVRTPTGYDHVEFWWNPMKDSYEIKFETVRYELTARLIQQIQDDIKSGRRFSVPADYTPKPRRRKFGIFYDYWGKPCTAAEASEMLKNKVVAKTTVETVMGEFEVSTVYLATDHDTMAEFPVIYETMVFPDTENVALVRRYSTPAEAREGHLHTVEIVKERAVNEKRRLDRREANQKKKGTK